jgi:carboxypeptidase Taq
MEKARGDLPELDAQFRQGVYVPLKEWLNRQVHEHGQRWRAPELCQRVTGKPLSHHALLRHLRGKFGPLYGI